MGAAVFSDSGNDAVGRLEKRFRVWKQFVEFFLHFFVKSFLFHFLAIGASVSNRRLWPQVAANVAVHWAVSCSAIDSSGMRSIVTTIATLERRLFSNDEISILSSLRDCKKSVKMTICDSDELLFEYQCQVHTLIVKTCAPSTSSLNLLQNSY